MLQCQKVIKELEFIKEHVKKSLTCNLISCVDGSLQPEDIAVFEVYQGYYEVSHWNGHLINGPIPPFVVVNL